jgi:hypothetical protein
MSEAQQPAPAPEGDEVPPDQQPPDADLEDERADFPDPALDDEGDEADELPLEDEETEDDDDDDDLQDQPESGPGQQSA